MKKNIHCRMGFYVYQVTIFLRTLEVLKIFEEMLNKINKTLQPSDKIEALKSQLETSIEEMNLRNKYALARKKYYYLTTSEWNILQNSLCVSRGFQENHGNDLFSEPVFAEILKLHSRFETTTNRIVGGYKARGYKIDKQKLDDFIAETIDHEPDKAIKTLRRNNYDNRKN